MGWLLAQGTDQLRNQQRVAARASMDALGQHLRPRHVCRVNNELPDVLFAEGKQVQ